MLELSILEATTRRALAAGVLKPIATEPMVLEDGGIRFVVRAVSSLERKAKARDERADPLGDYEPELFVCDVAPEHYVLLNKYNVLPNHLLIVTRRFEPQEAALTAADFEALELCMAGFGNLGFYNCGTLAGASQQRKHLQLVAIGEIPVERFLENGGALPFVHAFAHIPAPASAAVLHECYRGLVGHWSTYNVLVTRRWMLVVPRKHERFESISVNALGFAGTLFARSRSELERIRSIGPMNVLRHVAAT